MSATPAIFDMSDSVVEAVNEVFPEYSTGTREGKGTTGSKGGIIGRPITSNQKKQIRKRARRQAKVSTEDMIILYDGKTIDQWDHEELARGRPRAKDGSFKGAKPSFIDRKLHEDIVRRFEVIVREEMNAHTVEALTVIGQILEDAAVDEKGRPIVAAGTKLDAAKFLIEHVIGKPKQRTESDISVKLQGILGHAIVNPTHDGSYALTSGYIDAPAWEDTDLDRDE